MNYILLHTKFVASLTPKCGGTVLQPTKLFFVLNSDLYSSMTLSKLYDRFLLPF